MYVLISENVSQCISVYYFLSTGDNLIKMAQMLQINQYITKRIMPRSMLLSFFITSA